MNIEPENPADFEQKVRFYLSNKQLLKEQGESGYIYAKKHFDRELLALKYLSHLEQFEKK